MNLPSLAPYFGGFGPLHAAKAVGLMLQRSDSSLIYYLQMLVFLRCFFSKCFAEALLA